MASSLNHTCSKTGTAAGDIDCSACQLAQLCNRPKPAEVEEDDYSISTELTSKGNDYSILYLVIAAVGVFAVVLLVYKLFLM